MEMENTTIKVTHWKYEYHPVYTCVNRPKNVTTIKKKPKCTKVPKYQCTSKWKYDPIKGEKVRVLFKKQLKWIT